MTILKARTKPKKNDLKRECNNYKEDSNCVALQSHVSQSQNVFSFYVWILIKESGSPIIDVCAVESPKFESVKNALIIQNM